MLDFKEKIFYNEYAVSAYQIAQTAIFFLLKDDISKSSRLSLLGGFATFLVHKQFSEGLRANSFLLLLSEALILLRQNRIFKVPYWALFSSISLYFLSIKKLKVYSFPKPRGIYPVGYIHKIEPSKEEGKQDLIFSIYYPCTNDGRSKDRRWMATEEYWRRMHDTNMKDKERPGKVPQFFFRIQGQYLNKLQMGVLENAKLISIDDLYYKSPFNHIDEARLKKQKAKKEEKINEDEILEEEEEGASKEKKMNKFPVVLISHGIAGHCNAYTLFAKELASKGYIVFSMEHKEEIKSPFIDRDENWSFRYEQLQVRLQTSKRMLSIIYNQDKLKEIFSSEEDIQLDYNKISALGHSFGGSTALYTAMYDQRITGVVVGLDPCVFAFSKEERETCDFPRPLLCINSEDFYRRLYPWFQNDEWLDVIFKNLTNFKNCSLNCAVKGLAHANQSDLALVMAGEFDLYGITTKGECAKKHMFLNLMLFEYYFERYLINEEEKLPIQQFLKDYFNIIGKQNLQSYIFNKSINL